MITLKLDTNAVKSLFPEGSEARLDLQKAVLANVAQYVGKETALDDETLHFLKNHAASAAQVAVKQWLNTYTPAKSSLTEAIVMRARADVDRLMMDMLQDELQKVAKEFSVTLREQLEAAIERRVRTGLERFADTAITSAVSERFQQALESLKK